MNILLKHTLKSVKENRAQIVMIVITIIVVTVMIFASFSMYDIFFNINAAEYTRLAKDAHMIVGQQYDGEGYSKNKINDLLKDYDSKIDYKLYFVKMSAILKTQENNIAVLVEATDIKDYFANNRLQGSMLKNPQSLEHPYVVISKLFADENSLNLGDDLEIYLPTLERFKKFSVYAISDNSGIFASGRAINVLIDIAEVNSQGLINVTLIKFNDLSAYAEVEQHLNNNLSAIVISEAHNNTRVNEIATNNTILFSIALLFVIAMMTLILSTSYMIIAKSRLNEMIIFKTAGASPMQTTLIMLFEVLFYASIGALAGLIIGRIALHFSINALMGYFEGAITYQWWKWVISFVLSVSVAVVASLIPILNISRKSIREMTSGTVKEIKTTKPLIVLLTVFSIVVLVIIMNLVSNLTILLLSILLIILIAIFIIKLTPNIINWVTKIINKISDKSIIRLSSITSRRNASMHSVTILLATVIAFSFLVVAVVNLVTTAVTLDNSRYQSDFIVEYQREEGITLEDLLTLENSLIEQSGVQSAYLTLKTVVFLENDKQKISMVGINNIINLEHIIKGKENIVFVIDPTSVSNPAVFNIDLLNRYNLNIGDEIIISKEKLTSTGSVTFELSEKVTIVGIDYSATEYDKYIFVNAFNFVHEGNLIENSKRVFVNINDKDNSQLIYNDLRDYLEHNTDLSNKAFLFKYDEWLYGTARGLGGVYSLLALLQIAICLVAFLGIVNISIVTAYDRKDEFNIYKFTGMSVREYILHALGESAIIGVVGVIIGAFVSIALYQIMPALSMIADKYMHYSFINLSLFIVLAIAFMLFILMWLSIAKSNRKQFEETRKQNQRLL